MDNFGKFYQKYEDNDFSSSYELLEVNDNPPLGDQQTITRFWVEYSESVTFYYQNVVRNKTVIFEFLKDYRLPDYEMLYSNIKSMIDEFNPLLKETMRVLEDVDTEIFISESALIAQSKKLNYQFHFASNKIKHEKNSIISLIGGNETFNMHMFGDFFISLKQTDDFFEMSGENTYKNKTGDIYLSGVHKIIDLMHRYLRELVVRAKYFEAFSEKRKALGSEHLSSVDSTHNTDTNRHQSNTDGAQPITKEEVKDWSDIVGLLGILLTTIISIKVNSWIGGILGIGVFALWTSMKDSVKQRR